MKPSASSPARPRPEDEPAARRRIADRLEFPDDDTCVILDFDETLFLRNSTELYLASLRPRWLATAVLATIDLVRPWVLLPGQNKRRVYRDWLRVLLTTLLMPWSLMLWRVAAPEFAQRWANRELLDVVRSRTAGPLHVATLGFRPIVAALLAHVAPEARLSASGSLWRGYEIRGSGKRSVLEQALGIETVDDAVIITDSKDDVDLLAARRAMIVEWPGSLYQPAYSHHYLPFRYTQKGKRAGQNYLWHNVVLEDVVLLWIAFAWQMENPIAGAVSLLVLHLAFWIIYEIGYWENDTVATTIEQSPTLSVAAKAHAGTMNAPLAWVCAIALSIPGVWLLSTLNAGSVGLSSLGVGEYWLSAALLAVWVFYLIGIRAIYWIYNRIDETTRAYAYAALQWFRTLGYSLILATSLLGALLLCSLLFARWLPYLTYRYNGALWGGSYRLLMLGVFIVLCSGGLAVEEGLIASWQGLAALAWLTAYAHKPIRHLWREARFHRV